MKVGDKFVVKYVIEILGYKLIKGDELVVTNIDPNNENVVEVKNYYFKTPLWTTRVNITTHCDSMGL